MKISKFNSSFRDPSGFVFSDNKFIYRQVNKGYQKNFKLLIESGLYQKLSENQYLVSHQEIKFNKQDTNAFKILKVQTIPFISYPYEWCFSQFKTAAILTLKIQKIALDHGMSLKDASAYNIQFYKGKPILIDTLSFEKYEPGKPWVAYKQFVQHFLCPLALMSFSDIQLNRLTALFIDGIPMDLSARILPMRSRLNLGLMLHIFAHASSQKKYAETRLTQSQRNAQFSRQALLGLIDNLENTLKSLSWTAKSTEWFDYYQPDKNNYSTGAMKQKAILIEEFVKQTKPETVWDLGANTGYFSRIAGRQKALVLSFDNDYGALERNYLDVVKNQEENILPLFCDLTNPSPSIGWGNLERPSLIKRKSADLLMALALVHHLAIGQNIPLNYIASLFAKLGKYLIIEFVPKEDSQVKKLLQNREDIFSDYNQKSFEKIFEKYFKIEKSCLIKGSLRQLYLMHKI